VQIVSLAVGTLKVLHSTWRSGERKVGDQLNLERAMGPHVRFGGHFVQVSLYHLPLLQALTLSVFARVMLTTLQR
jgi:riboflavin synthase alpha subunit